MDIFVYLTLCFTSLFTLMDPLGVMPVFLQMTDGMDTKERRYIALKACTIAFIILVLFTLSGRFLFHFFGISTNGFRIVGGIIIFKIGYDMLQAHFTHVKLNETERKEYSKDITITPLAIPMLCGPGAISSGITLMEDASEYTFKIVLLGVIALVCILSFFRLPPQFLDPVVLRQILQAAYRHKPLALQAQRLIGMRGHRMNPSPEEGFFLCLFPTGNKAGFIIAYQSHRTYVAGATGLFPPLNL